MKKVRILYTRVLKKVQRDGILIFLNHIIQLVTNTVFLKRRAYLLQKSLEEPVVAKSLPDVVVMQLRMVSDMMDLVSCFDDNLATKFKERLDNNKLGFLGIVDNRLASYCWVSLNDEYETWLGTHMRVGIGDAYFYDSFTYPEYRSIGIHSAILHYALISLKNRGYKSALAIVGIKNIPALKTYRKLGFIEVKIITTLRIFRVLVKTNKFRL